MRCRLLLDRFDWDGLGPLLDDGAAHAIAGIADRLAYMVVGLRVDHQRRSIGVLKVRHGDQVGEEFGRRRAIARHRDIRQVAILRPMHI